MKKSKLIKLICSLTLAAVLVLIVLLVIAMNSMTAVQSAEVRIFSNYVELLVI